MATIYDEIKNQFCEKINEENHKIDIENENISPEILKLGINVLIEQIKKLRKNNFIESNSQVSSDANEILKTLDFTLNETK
jgi:hypothetical protein